MAQIERSGHADAVVKKIDEIQLEALDPDDDTAEYRSDLQLRVASLLRSQQQQRQQQRRVKLSGLKTSHWWENKRKGSNDDGSGRGWD